MSVAAVQTLEAVFLILNTIKIQPLKERRPSQRTIPFFNMQISIYFINVRIRFLSSYFNIGNVLSLKIDLGTLAEGKVISRSCHMTRNCSKILRSRGSSVACAKLISYVSCNPNPVR